MVVFSWPLWCFTLDEIFPTALPERLEAAKYPVLLIVINSLKNVSLFIAKNSQDAENVAF